METMVRIGRTGAFRFAEAHDLLPLVRQITVKYRARVEALMAKLECIELEDPEVLENHEVETNRLVGEWHLKIRKLGAEPKGLWRVNFDAGDGYYCWSFPDTDRLYWHDYHSTYSERIELNPQGQVL